MKIILYIQILAIDNTKFSFPFCFLLSCQQDLKILTYAQNFLSFCFFLFNVSILVFINNLYLMDNTNFFCSYIFIF